MDLVKVYIITISKMNTIQEAQPLSKPTSPEGKLRYSIYLCILRDVKRGFEKERI